MVASADLGGLGAKDGPPVTYNWAMASLLPAALPWLAILCLLVFKPNRFPRAWWVLVPPACLACGIGFLLDLAPSVPSELAEVLHDFVGALATGLAAVWLLSAYLSSRFRILNVLGCALVLEVFSLAVFVLTQDYEFLGGAAQIGALLALSAALIPASIGLAGWLCRRRYRPLALSAWVLVMLLGLCFLTLLPFAIIAGANVSTIEIATPVLFLAGACFGVLLPFLLLSFANGLYRQRLIALLRLAPELPPVIPTAPIGVKLREAP